MKKIEAAIRRNELNKFFQCAEKLGIFGFDLSETPDSSRKVVGGENGHQSRFTVDFAVFDAETRDTVHAVLEQAHPDSIAIFKLSPNRVRKGSPVGVPFAPSWLRWPRSILFPKVRAKHIGGKNNEQTHRARCGGVVVSL